MLNLKTYCWILVILFGNFHFSMAQNQPMFVTNGKLNLQTNTPFQSIEESYEIYFYGYPPNFAKKGKLQKKGIRNFETIHPDTITIRQSAKITVAAQEVILNYKVNPKGYIYFVEKHNRRTGTKISETTTEWKDGKITVINTPGYHEYSTSFEYDEAGRLKIKQKDKLSKSGSKSMHLKSSYTYGKHPNDRSIVFERRNRYAGKRSRIHSSKKKAIEQVFDSKDKLTEETKIKYNRRGQVVLMNKKNLRKDTTSKTVFKYKYDKRGNWVEQKEYCDKLLMAVRERVIVY